MATSDNVVGASLNSKHKPFLSMLTYRQGVPEIMRGVSLNQYTTRYQPHFDEFEVDGCILPITATVVFPSVAGPSVFLFLARYATGYAGVNSNFLQDFDWIE
ncbi:hypothetical protein Dsin_028840 [Dipteronia sinensis]|uniref:Uncharacterized protein n=1 Tax=Dipteronia sinensis TaxID=43782 RepID=A0AAE0DUZ8_9ROSI|nr:hypothetical protein Dsin_028840 [Dipteronia sinensis]